MLVMAHIQLNVICVFSSEGIYRGFSGVRIIKNEGNGQSREVVIDGQRSAITSSSTGNAAQSRTRFCTRTILLQQNKQRA